MRKYVIIGAGGTGGALGAYLARAGKDVTFIARGEHLKAMKENGLRVIRMRDEFTINPVKACEMQDYSDRPDVILVCVKGYSVDSVIPFIKRVAGPETVVIPILNVYGTGGKMQEQLPGILVTDGCMYIASQKKEPGVILMSGDILRVVFGVRKKEDYRPVLKEIERDFLDSDIRGILSDNIRRDALQKFAYVSPQGACGLYYDIPAGPMQKEGKYRDTFWLAG
ncbi:MAG: NAD(P)-binding domain-containing protein [Eubacterium sp.]|jgi:2-dehydropantoate 2-reductase|uniref:ketopantoate reductase family protein n=1 Tax=Eubacterium sp. F2 TaxID=3381348 RepID=UPI00390822AA|nr:NAD(P)-binding domain-containing protein [Eubacterium sp.]